MEEYESLSRDGQTVLMELYAEHTHKLYPQDWMKACDLSGPMGKCQARALRELLRLGLVIRKRGSFANRYRRWLWRLSENGSALAESVKKARLTKRGG